MTSNAVCALCLKQCIVNVAMEFRD